MSRSPPLQSRNTLANIDHLSYRGIRNPVQKCDPSHSYFHGSFWNLDFVHCVCVTVFTVRVHVLEPYVRMGRSRTHWINTLVLRLCGILYLKTSSSLPNATHLSWVRPPFSGLLKTMYNINILVNHLYGNVINNNDGTVLDLRHVHPQAYIQKSFM